MEGTPVLDSVLDMALDGGLTKGDGGPKLDPDRKLTFSEIPHAPRNDDLVLGAPVPLPAENVGRVTLLPAEVRLGAGDVDTDENITVGLQCWNTEGDVLDQYETFNCMYDSEDSDWDDPFTLASVAYVEHYNFDVAERMDLMVHRHSRNPDSSDVQQDCQMDVAPVCQTVSYVTQVEWDTFDDDSLAEAADADGPNMDEFYQRVVSSFDKDFVDSDDGSVTDLARDMSDGEDCCDSAPFNNANFGTCEYYEPIDLKSHIKDNIDYKNKQIQLYMHINCRGLSSNWEHFHSMLCDIHSEEFTFDYIGISEVFNCTNDRRISLPGYHPIITRCRDINVDYRGGVALFEHIDFTIRDDLSIFIPHVYV